MIHNERGNSRTPTFATFTGDEILIGESAKAQITRNPINTIFDAKRLIGRRFDQLKESKLVKHWPFDVIYFNSLPYYKVDCGKDAGIHVLSPTEVSAVMLKKMKTTAENYLNQQVTDAVITVPAKFNQEQREETQMAGAMAGLNVLRLVNEPTAAAMAYGLEKNLVSDDEMKILVFDLGGGSLDVSLLIIQAGIFEVRATAGNIELGGENFDNYLVDHLIEEVKNTIGVDVKNNQKIVRRLKREAEEAKHQLSESMKTTIMIDGITGDKDFSTSVTRDKFEEMCDDLFKATIESVDQAMKDACMDKVVVNEVILVGGSTKIPRIQELLQQYFPCKTLNKSINPYETVAIGAAIQAAILSGDKSPSLSEFLLADVAPFSLGVKTGGGLIEFMLKRNTTIPTKQTMRFTTAEETQRSFSIQVYEGESKMCRDNTFMGSLSFTPRDTEGDINIDISFDIDAGSNLTLTVYEVNSGMGKKKKINKILCQNDEQGDENLPTLLNLTK